MVGRVVGNLSVEKGLRGDKKTYSISKLSASVGMLMSLHKQETWLISNVYGTLNRIHHPPPYSIFIHWNQYFHDWR